MTTRQLASGVSDNKGFSLVELSIVLVILGLLIGGVLGGRSLIKAAQLRTITQEVQQLEMAIHTFKNKYGQFPGDFQKAASFWPSTWDGNGNGRLNAAPTGGVQSELFTFWQHLALAGIITGTYTGIAGPANNLDVTIGENVPPAKYPGGGFSVAYHAEGDGSTASLFTLDYGNMLQFGAKLANWETGEPILTPEEAFNIDSKMDDGLPARGKVIGRYWNNRCSMANDGNHSTTNLNARYKLTEKIARCTIIFRDIF